MRTRLLQRVLTAALAALVVLPAAAHADMQFWVIGRGFGHGIGMSQYGAKGFADKGYGVSAIMAFYYSGATLGAAPADAGNVDVLLRRNLGSASFDIEKPGSLVHAGTTYQLLAGDRVVFTHTLAGVAASRTRGGTSTSLYSGDFSVATLTGTDGFAEPGFTSENGLNGGHYRGNLLVSSVGGRIQVVNRVGLDNYLRGVVPSEMPASWHLEALKAQAIAARSYAIANRRTGDFDLYADTRSQMYLGIDHEQPTTDTAIAQTAGQVLLYDGKVIPAYFSSSNGGRTAANEDVWGGEPRPYLRSKVDTFDKSPYTPWTNHLSYSPGALAKKLDSRVLGRLTNVLVTANASARAEHITLVGSGGRSAIPPSSFQAELGLRSTWFRVERLGLFAVTGKAQVRGFAPRSSTTSLVYRDNGAGPWKVLKTVTPSKTGTFISGAPRPASGSRVYRLKRHGWLGPSVKVLA